jgi:hypothetical protein
MDNVTFIDIEESGVVTTHAIIDRGNGEFTSMLKSTYDEIIAQREIFANYLPTLEEENI